MDALRKLLWFLAGVAGMVAANWLITKVFAEPALQSCAKEHHEERAGNHEPKTR